MSKSAEDILAEQEIVEIETLQETDESPNPDVEELAQVSEVTDQPAGEMFRTFTDQPLAVLGELTTDARILASDMDLTFRSMPMPLQWCEKNEGGHLNSTTVGVIESVRLEDGKVLGSGYLLNLEASDHCAQLLSHGVASPSADLGSAEWHYTDDRGSKLESNEAIMEYLEAGGSPQRKITKGHMVGATLVPFPAIGSAKLELNSDRSTRDVGLVASAAEAFRPRVYDHVLFENPQLTAPTSPTMDESGRIYGHLAVFGQCHRSVQSQCVMVPRSPSGYAHFHTSPSLRLDDGKHLPVGRLTVGTGHADPRLRPAPAAAHSDDTGACFALVRVGEDAHGVWFSGVAAPWATTEQIEQGLSSPLSGDWRNFGQGLDLIAALAVNTPGFAVQGRDDDEGRAVALVASMGPVHQERTHHVTRDDIRTWIREALVDVSRDQQFAIESESLAVDDLETMETTYAPPKAVQEEAQRALAWIKEGKAGSGFTDVGRKRASDLAAGRAVSLTTIERIASYLARHEIDKVEGWAPGDEGYPSPGRVAWAAWGGEPAKAWSAGILKSTDAKAMSSDETVEVEVAETVVSLNDQAEEILVKAGF